MVSVELWSRIESRIELPPLPRTTARLRELRGSDDVEAVAGVVEEDPSLAVRVLATANSSYFGLQEEVGSIARATMTLGIRNVYNLVLQTELFDTFAGVEVGDFELDLFWRHCVLVAQLCRDLEPRCSTALDPHATGGLLDANELYTCGLLHDVGKVSMLSTLGSEYADLLSRSRSRSGSSVYLERGAYGYTHTEVGAMIAQLWGLPRKIADSIEMHHLPRVRLRERPYAVAVALADELAHVASTGDEIDPLHFSTNPFFGYLGYDFEGTKTLVTDARAYEESIELY